MDRWNVVIGNVDEDYTTEKWNDVFASVKVKVSGDFTEKDLSTPASCFETKEIGNIYTKWKYDGWRSSTLCSSNENICWK